MGVGTPANLLEAVSRGVDMFDCVMPTRNGRNGMIFTSQGIINIKMKDGNTTSLLLTRMDMSMQILSIPRHIFVISSSPRRYSVL